MVAPPPTTPPSSASSSMTAARISQGAPSLYQRCVQLTERLSLVPGFTEIYDSVALNSTQPDSPTIQQPARPDPVTLLWSTFRVGSSLCLLVNHLRPDTIKKINSAAQSQQNANLAKANVYHFLLACRNVLNFSEDDLFSISELYKDDTNGFVKILRTVELVTQLLIDENKLSVGGVAAGGQSPEAASQMSAGGQSHREKIVRELLETERKYVADLEFLHNYKVMLQEREIISVQDSRLIFSNLSNLLDLQRKFLIGLEQVCVQPAEQQLFGQLFVYNEEAFAVYGPYCANHSTANETVLRLKDALMKAEDIMEPTRQLPSYLIRPVQRICKYPLLLRELLRHTDKSNEDLVDDLNSGYATVSRVTSMINEISRSQENAQIAAQLAVDVEDWKGFNIEDFGDLLLDMRIIMSRKGVDKDMHMFLFEKILICCKEQRRERSSRGISRILSGGSGGRAYSLKGGVTISEIEGIVASAQAPNFALKIFYRDYDTGDMESFTLQFMNEEPLQAWQQQLEQLLDRHRRRSAPVNPRERMSRVSSATAADRPSSAMPGRGPSARRPSGQDSSLAGIQNVSRRSSDISETINSLDYAMSELDVLRERTIHEDSKAPSPPAVRARTGSLSQHSQPRKASASKLPPAPIHAPPPVPSLSTNSRQQASLPTPLTTPEPPAVLEQTTQMMKAKVHFGGDIFLIFVPANIRYTDLVQRLCDKLYETKAVEQRAQALRNWSHRVRYEDEDGDFITVRGDQDIAVAVKLAMAGSTTKRPVIHLHVE